jgi:hypothetical protein
MHGPCRRHNGGNGRKAQTLSVHTGDAVGQPWGLSGSQFLGVDVGAIALTVVIPATLRSAIRGRPGSWRGWELSPYEAAYLAGGRASAAQVAVADMVGSGQLRVDSAGRLTKVTPNGGPPGAAAGWPPGTALPDGLRTSAACKRLGSAPGIAAIRALPAGWRGDLGP